MFTIDFWNAAGERAVNTFAQGILAGVGVGAVGFQEIAWLPILSVAGVAAVLSILKSIIVQTATGDGPSFTKSEVLETK